MTDTIDNLRDYQALRWRRLAEKRLEHITELFVSGRWTRYFGERDFLEIVRQSKAAVDAWRKLECAARPDERMPDSPFAKQNREVEQSAIADSTEADLEAVAMAMAEIEAPDASPGAVEEPDEPNAVDEPPHQRLASLLRSPFEDALGAVARQRLRPSG